MPGLKIFNLPPVVKTINGLSPDQAGNINISSSSGGAYVFKEEIFIYNNQPYTLYTAPLAVYPPTVTVNGITQQNTDYTISGTTLVLLSAEPNDIVRILYAY